MNITAETMALMKAALKNGSADLAKAVSTGYGLTYYDLQAPAKNLYPTITKLRNMTPRVGRPAGFGLQSNWKIVSAITGSGFDAMGWIPEGQRSGAMSYTTSTASAAYVTLGEEDYLTMEAESAAEGFEDLNATLSMRLLQKTMRKEENGLLAGNGTGTGGIALGTPSTPSLSAVADTSATLPTATYSVIVVALTAEGWLNCKGNAAAGFTPSKTITGMDGQTYTLNGGNSNKSANATQAITSGTNGLFASVTPVSGAVAYAWFVGTAGSETLQAITTVNVAYFNVPLAASRQAISTVTSDNSQNATAFSGYLSNAFSGGIVQLLSTGTSANKGAGSTLTASGKGSVVEIDALLKSMWDSYRLGPTVIWVSSQEQNNITAKVLNGASSPLLRYDVNASGDGNYSLTANGQIRYYYNPFTGGGMETEGGGGDKIPIIAHPDLPPGTVFAHCAKLPEWYQSNEVPNTAEVITRRDYYRIDWPLRTRRREYGIYAEEVLAVYAPFALGIITNIQNG
ncbi:MAG TPA: hypothetical protein VHT03_01535 [Rhizomicrobium sp.]|jgi:hypothetical protein|nr:hypothetical protein [Rhizomicrobium sp.]